MEELHGIWKELYQVALEIRDLAPWEFLWSENKIAILLPGKEVPVYCNVLGKAGNCYGICVYHTVRGIYGAKWMEENNIPQPQRSRYQECLVYYLGNREHLSARDRRLLSDLGLKFRGKNAWPYFRELEANCLPSELTPELAKLMVAVLRNLFMVVRALKEGRIACRFDRGEMLYRVYDEERDGWRSYADKAVFPSIHYPQATISDELLLERLRRTIFVEDSLEIDLASLGIPAKGKQYSKPYYLRRCIFADHDTGEIELNEPFLPGAQPLDLLVEGLVSWIELYQGRPEEIIVRDEELYVMMAGVCSQLDIPIFIDPQLEVVDQYVEQVLADSEV